MLTAGTTVSGYRIEGLVGEGGMATVYEAHQPSLDRTIALKVLARRLGDDPSFRERFRREWHIQAALDHPNIVPVYEAGDSEHGLWLAMRLVRGPTLRELMAERQLAPAEAVALLAPVAAALDAAHERGLIHRDISPQNILVDERGQPYLSDFGITKGPGHRSLTRTGQFIGTLDYIAPEQIQDEPSTGATDTYALGAIIFECLTGRVPFEKSTEAAVLYAHISDPPPAASVLAPALPKAIDPVLARALAKKPSARFGSATELIAAAERALGQASARQPAPPARYRRAPRRLAAAAAAVALPALAALGFGVLTGDNSTASARRVAAGDLAVSLPSGWSAVRGDDGGVPGLPLEDVVTLRPQEGSGGGSVLVGLSPATGKTLLPSALAKAAVGPARGQPVSLGSLEALRYRDLKPDESPSLAVFAAPASAGVATLACRPYRPGTDFMRRCEQVAASLELRAGRAFPLGPSPRLEAALQTRLDRLNEERRRLRGRLARTASAGAQASFASGLAVAFRRAARGLAGLDVTPQSAAALESLIASLRMSRDSYKGLAGAARSEDEAAYGEASAAVGEAEASVDRRVAALQELGYEVEGAG